MTEDLRRFVLLIPALCAGGPTGSGGSGFSAESSGPGNVGGTPGGGGSGGSNGGAPRGPGGSGPSDGSDESADGGNGRGRMQPLTIAFALFVLGRVLLHSAHQFGSNAMVLYHCMPVHPMHTWCNAEGLCRTLSSRSLDSHCTQLLAFSACEAGTSLHHHGHTWLLAQLASTTLTTVEACICSRWHHGIQEETEQRFLDS